MTDDKTKAKIYELCPDVVIRTIGVTLGKKKVEEIDLVKDITLSVVLRAIKKTQEYSSFLTAVACNGGFYEKGELKAVWNLEMDSWDSQSPETQAFVGSLLGVNNSKQ